VVIRLTRASPGASRRTEAGTVQVNIEGGAILLPSTPTGQIVENKQRALKLDALVAHTGFEPAAPLDLDDVS